MQTVGFYMGERCTIRTRPPEMAEEDYLNGLVEQVGHVDSYVGHVYRWFSYLIHTDSDGNKMSYQFTNEEAARRALALAGEKFDAEHFDEEG